MSTKKLLNCFGYYLTTLYIISVVVSLMLKGRIYGFHFLGLLFLPLSFIIFRLFVLSSIHTLEISFKIRLITLSLLINISLVFIIGMLLQSINNIPFISDRDDFMYNEQAIYLAKHWVMNGFSYKSLYTGSYSGFPNLSALLMYITGIHEWWIPRIGNAFLGSFIALHFFNITKVIYGDIKSAKFVASLAAFSPIVVVYSILQMKDMLLAYLLFGAFSYYLHIIKNRVRIIYIILIVTLLGLMLFIRPASIITFIFSIIIFHLFFEKNKMNLKKSILISLIVIGLLLIWNFLAKNEFTILYDTYIDERLSSRIDGSSTININAQIRHTDLMDFISFPLYIFISPFFPTPLLIKLDESQKFFTNFEFIPSLFFIGLIPFIASSIFTLFKQKKVFNSVLIFFVFYILYRVGQSLSMSIFSLRQSLPAILSLFLLIPIVFYFEDNKKIRYISHILSIIVMVSYTVIRYYIRSNL